MGEEPETVFPIYMRRIILAVSSIPMPECCYFVQL